VVNLPDVSVGATWRCVDFHLHTPGVTSFALPPGVDVHRATDRERLVDEYVDRLVTAGVQVAALTDYQGVRQPWFDLIRDRGASSGIIVLPGAEISIGRGGGRGLHLLVICGQDSDPARVAEVIRHQHASPDPLFPDELRSGHTDLDLRLPIDDALRAIKDQLECVIIAAHATSNNGALKVLGAKQTADLIHKGLIDAVDQCEGAKAKLRSSGVLTAQELDRLAFTVSSDPKSLEEVGAKKQPGGHRRLTWVKLSAFDAAALRLALHDPGTRILTRPPAPVHHPRILSMQVEGGFLDGLVLRFSDDLTTLIGGRGAGKSAILETLRYALDGMPYSDQSERLSLVRHALGSGGRVRVIIERPGTQLPQRYEVSRVLEQRPRVVSLPNEEIVQVPPLELFGSGGSPVMLLQREIQAVARDDGFRRRLLDEIIGDEARHADVVVQRTVEELRRNARSAEELERRLERRDERLERLNRVNADISYYEQQGVAEKLDRHSKAGADRARLETAVQVTEDTLLLFREDASALAENLGTAASDLSAAQSEHAHLLKQLAQDIRAVNSRLSTVLGTTQAELAALRERITTALKDWPRLVEPLEEDLRRIQRELGAGALDAERYVNAVSERTALLPIVEGLARLDEEQEKVRSARDQLLHRLQDNRRAAFLLRQRAAEEVNHTLDGRLRMNVTYLGDTEDFRARLSSVLKGSGVTADAIRSVADAPGSDGVELAQVLRQGPASAVKRFGITEAMAQRLCRWTEDDPARMRQIEVLAPYDRVTIALNVDGSFRDLGELSSGQKATALLLLLFAQGGRPLILDQPEDDLDNRFVYEDVVTLLRAEKGVIDPNRRRQIVAATHNANIPVNGDAELVLSLVDQGGHCTVRTRASIDDAQVRSEIRTVLEGGAEAFRRRAEKYGGLDDT
jgi:chromosome segregation protein